MKSNILLLIVIGIVVFCACYLNNDWFKSNFTDITNIVNNFSSSQIKLFPIKKLPLKWGTYTGWKVADVEELETKLGQPENYLATFVHWGNDNKFPDDLGQKAKTENKTLIIFWEAMDYNKNTAEDPRFSYDSILSGDWDYYFSNFANSVKDFDSPVILIPFEEMNGDWYPWSITKNNNSASKHIAAYRHIHDLFASNKNVKFGWTINNETTNGTIDDTVKNLYPGDQYVDFVGVDGFNFGNPWQSFSQIFQPALLSLQKINKPEFIFSMSCAPGSEKANWIKNAFNEELPKYNKVIGFIWFNEKKEKDWRIWSDDNSLKAFKDILPTSSSN